MNRIKRIMASMATGMSAIVLMASPVAAADGYTLFGDAELVSPGNGSDTALQMRSDTDPGWGGANFDVPAGLTFADLTTLSTDFNVTDDNCGGGSPRFSVGLDQGGITKYVFVYLGDAPNYNTCTPDTWVNSGDLLETGKTVDTSQLGGTFYDNYDTAVTNYGGLSVEEIVLVTDGGWSQAEDGEMTVLADNVTINANIYGFEQEVEEPEMPTSKDECKKDGWKTYGVFKNQGDCVSWVTTNGRNKPALANNPTF